MLTRPFGRAGFAVSEIGFGAWGIGGTMWTKRPDDKAAVDALRRAVDLGITFFDTALAYGNGHSEQLIGRVLRENPGKPLLVATKIPPKNGRWPARHDVPAREVFPKDWIVACTEKSLRNLRVERLDLTQFHVWSDTWMAEDEWWEAVERLKRDGKVRCWGASLNDHQPESALKLVASGRADNVQVIDNIFSQEARAELFPLCQKQGVAVIVRVPFDEGSLTGSFTETTTFDDGDFRAGYFAGRLPEVVRRVNDLKFLLTDGLTMPQAALKFCLSHPAVSTVIPGMRHPARVDENVKAGDGRPFPDEILERLKAHAWPR